MNNKIECKKHIRKNNSERSIGISNTLLIDQNQVLKNAFWMAKNKAENARQMLDAFMANMRHDIKTPINGIVGFAHLIKEESKDEKVAELADNLLKASHSLLDFFNHLFEMTQLSLNHLPLLEKKINLRSILESIIHFNLAKTSKNKLSLIFDYDENIPSSLISDPERIYHIILELVTNAIKFTTKGKINVAATLEQNRESDVIIKIQIMDTGLGIPSDEREAIFERFKRLTPSYKGVYPGLGLGLTMVKQFIDDLSGEIYLESEAQKGSIFTCILPLKKVRVKNDFKKHVSTSLLNITDKNHHRLSNVHQLLMRAPQILLVEDNLIAAKALESFFKLLNCSVDVAVDGASSIERTKNQRYDLIFMDIGLPDLSGNEVTQQIREWESLHDRHTPIVALTAHLDNKSKKQCIKAGMDAVLIKPLIKRKAIAVLRKFIPQYKTI